MPVRGDRIVIVLAPGDAEIVGGSKAVCRGGLGQVDGVLLPISRDVPRSAGVRQHERLRRPVADPQAVLRVILIPGFLDPVTQHRRVPSVDTAYGGQIHGQRGVVLHDVGGDTRGHHQGVSTGRGRHGAGLSDADGSEAVAAAEHPSVLGAGDPAFEGLMRIGHRNVDLNIVNQMPVRGHRPVIELAPGDAKIVGDSNAVCEGGLEQVDGVLLPT